MLYKFRFMICGVFYISGCFIAFLLFLLRPFNPDNTSAFTKFTSKVIYKILGLNVIIRDFDSQNNQFVYIGNHQDTIDLFLFGSIYPKNTVTVGKKQVKYIPVFGWAFWLAGHLMIDRGSIDKAKQTLNIAQDFITQKNGSIFILPEGTRTRDKGLSEFKKGAFHLAINSQVPIKAFVISSYVKHIDLNKLNAGTIIIDSIDCFKTEGLTSNDVDKLRDQVSNAVKIKLKSLDEEVLSYMTKS